MIIIAAHLADKVGEDTIEMTAYEDFVVEKIRTGEPIIGPYPVVTCAVVRKFEEWRKANGR